MSSLSSMMAVDWFKSVRATWQQWSSRFSDQSIWIGIASGEFVQVGLWQLGCRRRTTVNDVQSDAYRLVIILSNSLLSADLGGLIDGSFTSLAHDMLVISDWTTDMGMVNAGVATYDLDLYQYVRTH